MESVAGIDLSGVRNSSRSRTAVAQIVLDEPHRLGDRFILPSGPSGDRILLEWAAEQRPSVVAIDAPLTFPHSLECASPSCPRCVPGSAEYLERDVDREARAQGGGMPFVMLAAIAFRGIFVARKLREFGVEVIETYPAAAYRQWGIPNREPSARAEAAEARIGPLGEATDDEIDAVTAALAAADFARGVAGGRILGDDGVIILPALHSSHARRV